MSCLICPFCFVSISQDNSEQTGKNKAEKTRETKSGRGGNHIISSGDFGVNRKQLIFISLADSSSNVYDCIRKSKQKRIYLVLLEFK